MYRLLWGLLHQVRSCQVTVDVNPGLKPVNSRQCREKECQSVQWSENTSLLNFLLATGYIERFYTENRTEKLKIDETRTGPAWLDTA